MNGKPVSPDDYKNADAKRLVDREFNLSYTTQLPDDNRVVGGNWYGTDGRAQVSIEQGIAKTINVKLGDTLRFDVAGLQVDGPVTSVRKVDWNSFKVNFFVLMPSDGFRYIIQLKTDLFRFHHQLFQLIFQEVPALGRSRGSSLGYHGSHPGPHFNQAFQNQMRNDLMSRVGIDFQGFTERTHRRKRITRTHLSRDNGLLSRVNNLFVK